MLPFSGHATTPTDDDDDNDDDDDDGHSSVSRCRRAAHMNCFRLPVATSVITVECKALPAVDDAAWLSDFSTTA